MAEKIMGSKRAHKRLKLYRNIFFCWVYIDNHHISFTSLVFLNIIIPNLFLFLL